MGPWRRIIYLYRDSVKRKKRKWIGRTLEGDSLLITDLSKENGRKADKSKTKTISFVFSLPFPLSSLCLGLPYVRLRPLDGVLRVAARLIGGVPKFGHIGEFMRDTLHWLPVRERILYRVSTIIAWRCILYVAPVYLSELFVLSSSCPDRDHFALPLMVTI